MSDTNVIEITPADTAEVEAPAKVKKPAVRKTLDTHTGEQFKYNTTVTVKLNKKMVKTVAYVTDLNVTVLHPSRLTPEKLASLSGQRSDAE